MLLTKHVNKKAEFLIMEEKNKPISSSKGPIKRDEMGLRKGYGFSQRKPDYSGTTQVRKFTEVTQPIG